MSLAGVPGDFHAQRSQLPSRFTSAVECEIRLLVTPCVRNNDSTQNPVEPKDKDISVTGIKPAYFLVDIFDDKTHAIIATVLGK